MKVLLLIGCLVALANADFVALQKKTPSHGAPNYLNFKCVDGDGKQLIDGFYADLHRGCHQYYQCIGGEKERYVCKDPQTIFNVAEKKCVSQQLYSCPSVKRRMLDMKRTQIHGPPDYLNFKCVNEDGKPLPDGFYADLNRGCHQYYQCIGGEKETYVCKEPETIYNQDMKACVSQKLYTCPSATKRTLEKTFHKRTQIHGPPDYLNFKCVDEDGKQLLDGFYADLHRGCHQYYQCIGGEKETYVCKEHETIYNQDMKACVSQKLYTCPSATKRTLEKTLQKKTPSLNFKCIDGDGKQLIDGFYADIHQGCHQYYECIGGEKERYVCKDPQTIFNVAEKKCVSQQLYSCPSATKRTFEKSQRKQETPERVLDCEGRKDGFYANRARQCKVYYRCVRGEKLTYRCGGGTRFDETRAMCDHKRNVPCNQKPPSVEEDAEDQLQALRELTSMEKIQKLRELLLELKGLKK